MSCQKIAIYLYGASTVIKWRAGTIGKTVLMRACACVVFEAVVLLKHWCCCFLAFSVTIWRDCCISLSRIQTRQHHHHRQARATALTRWPRRSWMWKKVNCVNQTKWNKCRSSNASQKHKCLRVIMVEYFLVTLKIFSFMYLDKWGW